MTQLHGFEPNAQAQPPQQGVPIENIIMIYCNIAGLSTPPTEARTRIIAKLEHVIEHFTGSFQIPERTN